MVPTASPRFAGDVMLDSRGDRQQVYASHLGGDEQKLQILNLRQVRGGHAWASARGGAVSTGDSVDNAVVLLGWQYNVVVARSTRTVSTIRRLTPTGAGRRRRRR